MTTTRYRLSLFIFRRDLRLVDNTALNAALQQSACVLPCFIFDPAQIEPHPYQSWPALQFMLQSLKDLQAQFSEKGAGLSFFYGSPQNIVETLIQTVAIDAVFINRDYSPFSRQRDETLYTTCQNNGIDLHVLADALLTEPEEAVKQNGDAYKVFTPFYNNVRRFPVPSPKALAQGRFSKCVENPPYYSFESLIETSSSPSQAGGRKEALSILEHLASQKNYQQTRDYPGLQSTSLLSAHLKFGTCSVREAHQAISSELGEEHPLIRQLYWRDFFTHIGYHYPKVFGHAFISKFDQIPWQNNLDQFKAWAEGRTGFPIVDAGMRELNNTGFMHNRVRMITASFLVKDLRISWRWGERYFAQHLVDYDPCVNNGNWQWAASTGCDAQPYFRIFNPWLQQQKFDPDCRYIYRWIPELKSIPAKIIHAWDKKYLSGTYPKPMIDHAYETTITKQLFKNCPDYKDASALTLFP
jgi:deoxyribodipyrimidine photo-lyase